MTIPVPDFRCSECGRPQSVPATYSLSEGEKALRVRPCREHPSAAMLSWDVRYEGTLYSIDRFLSQGGNIDELRNPTPGSIGSAQARLLVDTLLLFETWGGVPERQLPSNRDRSPAGLY